jgi:membrane-associated phospholipid phosphatase
MANASVQEILMKVNDLSFSTWAEMVGRMQSELKWKLFLALALNLWFYVPYCFLQRHHFLVPAQIPQTFIDRLIPFSDKAVWVYLSLFLLMPIGPLLMRSRRQLFRYGLGIFLIGAVAYLVFIVWPTSCPRPDPKGTIAAYRLVTMFDSPLHAFPSLHAAFAVFSALCTAQVFRELRTPILWQVGVGCWTVLILLATLVTKQHMLADMIAGSALGFGAYRCVFSERTDGLKTKLFPQTLNGNEMRPDSTTP